MNQSLNPIEALGNIKSAYSNYVSSFQKFKNPTIKNWVDDKIKEGNLLYKGPYIQLGRRFEQGDSFDILISEKLLHPDTSFCFTLDTGNRSAVPLQLYKHQSDAIRSIIGGKNTIISTGTGSGKSFCFGVPVVSTCLEMLDKGIHGIKAIFTYPMNALANSQYDDFSARLHGSGLKIAIYTGDTPKTRGEAVENYKLRTGRDPYDSELLSREEIQKTPPDILITNYVMLEYILTRFEDRVLFPEEQRGVLKYLVLDEVHTYTGRQGADVAYLIRRLKQHTGTRESLLCIGTSATVHREEGEGADTAITEFASNLFGENFSPDAVIRERYLPHSHSSETLLPAEVLVTKDMLDNFEDTDEKVKGLVEALVGDKLPLENPSRSFMGEFLGKQRTAQFIETNLSESIYSLEELVKMYRTKVRPEASEEACWRELLGAFLAGIHTQVEFYGNLHPRMIPKIHTFFSQGREIKSCIMEKPSHLNDAGEVTCLLCASKGKKDRETFPLVFCRACGQEYYCVELLADGNIIPHELGDGSKEGNVVYLYPGILKVNKESIPDNWLTEKKGDIKASYNAHFEPWHSCTTMLY